MINIGAPFDILSLSYATDEQFFVEMEFGTQPWTSKYPFEKYNPRALAKNMTTPTLIIHGEKDYRYVRHNAHYI